MTERLDSKTSAETERKKPTMLERIGNATTSVKKKMMQTLKETADYLLPPPAPTHTRSMESRRMYSGIGLFDIGLDPSDYADDTYVDDSLDDVEGGTTDLIDLDAADTELNADGVLLDTESSYTEIPIHYEGSPLLQAIYSDESLQLDALLGGDVIIDENTVPVLGELDMGKLHMDTLEGHMTALEENGWEECDLTGFESALDDVRQDLEGIHDQINICENTMEELQSSLSSLQSDKEQAQVLIGHLSETMQELHEQEDALTEIIHSAESALEDAEQDFAQDTEDLHRIETEYMEASADYLESESAYYEANNDYIEAHESESIYNQTQNEYDLALEKQSELYQEYRDDLQEYRDSKGQPRSVRIALRDEYRESYNAYIAQKTVVSDLQIEVDTAYQQYIADTTLREQADAALASAQETYVTNTENMQRLNQEFYNAQMEVESSSSSIQSAKDSLESVQTQLQSVETSLVESETQYNATLVQYQLIESSLQATQQKEAEHVAHHSEMENTVNEYETLLEEAENLYALALDAQEAANQIPYAKMELSISGDQLTIHFRSPSDSTIFEVGKYNQSQKYSRIEIGRYTVEHDGGTRDEIFTLRLPESSQTDLTGFPIRMVDPETNEVMQQIWIERYGRSYGFMRVYDQPDWDAEDIGRMESDPVEPILTVAAAEGASILLYTESPSAYTSVEMEGGGLMNYQMLSQNRDIDGQFVTLTMNTDANTGEYKVRLIDDRMGICMEEMTVFWDKGSKTLTVIDAETHAFTGFGDYVSDAELQSMSLEQRLAHTLEQEGLSIAAQDAMAAFREMMSIESIMLSDQFLSYAQGIDLLARSGYGISLHEMEYDYFYETFPDYHPDNIESYITQLWEDGGKTEERGAIQDRVVRQKLEMLNSYQTDLNEYSRAMGDALQAGMEYCIQVQQGASVAEMQLMVEQAMGHLRNNFRVNELLSIGVELPTTNQVIQAAHRMMGEAMDTLIKNQDRLQAVYDLEQKISSDANLQMDEADRDVARLAAMRQVSGDYRAQQGFYDAALEGGRRVTRAIDMMEIALAARNDSRAILVSDASEGFNIQRERAEAYANGKLLITQDEAIAFSKEIENAVMEGTDIDEIMQGILNDVEGMASDTQARAANAVVDEFLSDFTELEQQQFYIALDENIINQTLVASSATIDTAFWQTNFKSVLTKFLSDIGKTKTVGEIERAADALEKAATTPIEIGDEIFGTAARNVMVTGEGYIKIAAEYDPVSKIYAEMKAARLNEHIAEAADRYGADSNDEISYYHQELIKDKIFTLSSNFGESQESRPLLVIVLGNRQEIETNLELENSDSENDLGLRKIFDSYEDTHDIVMFRVGSAMSEIRNITSTSYNYDLHTAVVQKHFENVMYDMMHSEGLFTGHARPTEVKFTAYSFGAGATSEVLAKWNELGNGVNVGGTVFVDGVQLGIKNYGDGVNTPPPYSQNHIHIWQNNEDLSNFTTGGAPVHGASLGNSLIDKGDYREYISSDGSLREIFVESSNHVDIDEDEKVQNWIYNFLDEQLK